MIRHFLSAATFLGIVASSLAEEAHSSRAKFNFNSDWLLKVGDITEAVAPQYADSEWKKVTLPYAWNEDSAFKADIVDLPVGVAWYRKHFKLPAGSEGKKVYLEFEGIRQGGDFYLNGESIGRSDNGVMAFGFDITDKVKPAPAENVLAARIDSGWNYRGKNPDSGFQWNDKNFYANYGGINKNVFLHVTNTLHQTLPLYSNLGTTGVYVFAQGFDIKGRTAKVTAEAQVRNDSSEVKKFGYEVTIAELDGKPVQTIRGGEQTIAPGETKTASASARVSNLNFWSWGYGYLYDVSTTLTVDGKPVDTVVTRTGFRKLEFGRGMVQLNDRAIHLKGYAQRSTNEWPAIGQSVPPWMSDFSNGLVVESGGNLIRWMHVTPWKQDTESCDRLGLMHAMPAGDSEKDVSDKRWIQRVTLMREAIIYHRNNPSIVFYETGNNQVSEEHMAEMKALRDEYDPHGGRAAGSRNMLDSKVAEYGGEMLYINKSAGKPMWMMEYSRDEGLRKFWDDWSPPFHKDGDGPPHRGEPATAYNRNQDTHAVENVVRWFEYWRERPGTGNRVNAGGVNIYFSDSNTHHRGVANYRCSGEVDPMRLPKEGFFAHQVMWDGWIDPERPRAHIIGHWNYDADVKKPVYVVSSADKVELFINNQSKGFGEQSSRFLFSWKEVAFEAGEIKAIGYDAGGEKLCEAAVETAGAPAAIKLTPHTGPSGLKADGADLALVDVEVVDAKGNRCPTALSLIKFDLQGPAEWRGGIAVGPDNFILARKLPVECGINRVILRSQAKAGKIILSASADGVKSARLEVASTPYSTADGLTKTLPDAGLTPRLDRGPTPTGDGLRPTRTGVRIASATAGANAEHVAAAFDDTENTGWKSDGKRGTGWIEFALERDASVSEVTMKLGGWRRKSYPLRVTVDGKEAWSGYTQKTLGYVTISLNQPAQGRNVRIELAGAIEDKDDCGIVEITGKKLEDAKDGGARGVLEIIEAEIYEPLAAAGTKPNTPLPTAPAKGASSAKNDSFHIYLLMGQSNMVGRDTSKLASQVDNPRVLALNAEGKWVVARDPLHPKQGRTEPGAGPGLSFAEEMLKSDPKITIGLIPCAVGGSSIRSWLKGAKYYEATLNQARIAGETGVIKGILWHQGESDTDQQKEAELYESRLTKTFKDLREDLGLPNLPIVVGQLGDFLARTPEKFPRVEKVRRAIKQIPFLLPGVGYADSAGLSDKGDQLHFNADGAKELGKRFARAMQDLEKR